VKRLINNNFNTVTESKTLESLIEKIASTDDVIFPVLNDDNKLIGLIYLDDIRPIIFSAFKVKFTSITEVMQPVKDKDVVDFEDTIETIMNTFETTQQIILPVVQNKVFIGFISKADILEKYREQLKELVIE
jgi:CIC family chloride channel protein